MFQTPTFLQYTALHTHYTDSTLQNGARCFYPSTPRTCIAVVIHLGFGRTSLDILEDVRLVDSLRQYDLVVIDAPKCGYAFQQGYRTGCYTDCDFWNITLRELAETYALACRELSPHYTSVICLGESTAGAGLVDMAVRGVVPPNVQGFVLCSPALSLTLTWYQALWIRCLAWLPNRAVGSWLYSTWLPQYVARAPGSAYVPALYVDTAPISSHTLHELLQHTASLRALPATVSHNLPVVLFVSNHDVFTTTPAQRAADNARYIDRNINVRETVTLATRVFARLTVVQTPLTHCFQYAPLAILQQLAAEIGRLAKHAE